MANDNDDNHDIYQLRDRLAAALTPEDWEAIKKHAGAQIHAEFKRQLGKQAEPDFATISAMISELDMKTIQALFGSLSKDTAEALVAIGQTL